MRILKGEVKPRQFRILVAMCDSSQSLGLDTKILSRHPRQSSLDRGSFEVDD